MDSLERLVVTLTTLVRVLTALYLMVFVALGVLVAVWVVGR